MPLGRIVSDQIPAPKGKALKELLSWMLKSGQQIAPNLNYAPLPASVKSMVEQRFASIGDKSGT
jgi:hypothetical protein